MPRLLHIRVMALEEQIRGDAANTNTESSTQPVEPEDVVYSGYMAGECYIELSTLAEMAGQKISVPLSDQVSCNPCYSTFKNAQSTVRIRF